MALTVRTNVGALSAIKTLNNTQNSLTKSLGRVSFRIKNQPSRR